MAAGKFIRFGRKTIRFHTRGMKKKTASSYRRRYRRNGTSTVVNRGTTGFPDKLIVKMRYCDTYTLGNGVNTIGSHTFRANSVYDPDYTATGHQPLYFDQLATIYSNYKVIKTAVGCQFMSTQGVTAGNIICGVDISANDTVETNPDTIRERPGSKFKTLTPQRPATIKTGWNLRRSAVTSDDNWTSLASTNPVNVDYIKVYATSADGTTALPSDVCSVQVDLTYTVVWYNAIAVSGS